MIRWDSSLLQPEHGEEDRSVRKWYVIHGWHVYMLQILFEDLERQFKELIVEFGYKGDHAHRLSQMFEDMHENTEAFLDTITGKYQGLLDSMDVDDIRLLYLEIEKRVSKKSHGRRDEEFADSFYIHGDFDG